ncbi:MAG: xanthine dehydrogenase family protein subunit M [Deltaproteobacteria bacterium]|nr:xanthine dehydrogenase family protein subunit M [Deltaproteobacteria bacterium]
MIYHRPQSIDEALALKSSLGQRARFIAGGTDLVVGIRKGRTTVDSFVDLSRVPGLAGLTRAGDTLRIGAACTHAQLEREGITALAQACETVGGPQIRNMGTLGGQVGTASPAGDVSVALIALDAVVELASVRGTRSMPLADFFVGPGRTSLEPDEMVLSVTVPTNRKSVFYKIGKRDAVAISVVVAAASVSPSGDVAVGLGCVAPVPFRPRKSEQMLRGHPLTSERIDAAAAMAASEVSPISDHRGGATYRRAMVETLTRRLLRTLADTPYEGLLSVAMSHS